MKLATMAIFFGAALIVGTGACDGDSSPREAAATPTRAVGASTVLATATPEGALSPGSWTATGDMTEGRIDHTSTLLADGRVLVAGGKACPPGGGGTGKCRDADFAIPSAELWDPAADAWSTAPQMEEARFAHTSVLLEDGRVVAVGGEGADAELASSEVYDSGDRRLVQHRSTGGAAKLLRRGAFT